MEWTVYESPYNKIRIGKEYDGGYVIADLPINYEQLISAGVADDISFEEEFVEKYNTSCIAFDGTVNSFPATTKNITFIKKNIGTINDAETTNLTMKNGKYFLKMDIEGAELSWIRSLEFLDYEQMVIEFHFPFSYEDTFVFEKLNVNHYLIHFHANNCCGVRVHNNILIPNVFECTYLNKKYFKNPPLLNTECIPSSLDRKNVISNEEIYIDYPPFVNTNIAIYIIHYKKLKERKESMICQLKKHNLKRYEFIEIDRDELNEEDKIIFSSNYNNVLSAIFLSHLHAYHKIIEKNEYAFILEDDAILSDDFVYCINKYVKELPLDYDMLFLGNGCNHHIHKEFIVENKCIYKRKEGEFLTRCTDSYIVTPACCKKIINHISKGKINEPIDNWLNNIKNVNVYWSEPTIVEQGSQNGSFNKSY